ncbi:DNA/RNA nuclease SfsA [Pseudoalteromonas mariniglutinosa]|uniref:DNA/RNA nuclease SfsA n=1 Tax=Pseudoalteromonas mariniglutinosa TaxID=206042 RepID=UPI00384ED0CC
MKFTAPLKQAILLRRYKRFLADLRLNNNTEFTAHCANTGKMTGCADPGFTAYYSTSDNEKRKYPHSLELTKNQFQQLICVNTGLANKVVEEALQAKLIEPLSNYSELQTEVKYGQENSRIDFLLKQTNLPDCYVEVKSVTLLSQTSPHSGQGYFPDAKTLRGQKHLRELIDMRQQGHRSVLLFAVLHEGIQHVSIAKHIDEKYALLLQQAMQQGVEVLAYKANISASEITLAEQVKFIL